MRLVLVVALCAAGGCAGPEERIRRALRQATGVVRLPDGVVEIRAELAVPAGARDLEIVGGQGTVLRAADGFRGRALLSVRAATGIRLRNFTVDGNRAALERPRGLPPDDVPFARFQDSNGLLAENVQSLEVSGVRFRHVAGFALLVSGGAGVRIERVQVEQCGSRNARGRNNATGGILIEEGAAGFEVRDSVFRDVRGNGVWTHSRYTSPRSRDGLISGNLFERIGRDAVQVGHAVNVRVENNRGRLIGYPIEEVDVEGGGTPVAIDTAGNVEASLYARNRFEEINGKCIDLDGFHHGEVRENACVNREPVERYPFGHYGIVMNNTNPDMQSEGIVVERNLVDGARFGGIFLIGGGHRVRQNRLLRLNQAGCNESRARFGCSHFPGEPDLLQAGIYLGRRAERPAPARGNTIEENEITGHKMKQRCIIAAPGVSPAANRIVGNRCADGDPR